MSVLSAALLKDFSEKRSLYLYTVKTRPFNKADLQKNFFFEKNPLTCIG